MRSVGALLLWAVVAGGAAVCSAAPAKPKLPRCPTLGIAVGGADAFPKAMAIGGAVTGVVAMGEVCRATRVDTRVAGIGAVAVPGAVGFGGNVGAVDQLTGEPSIGLAGAGNDTSGAASPVAPLFFGVGTAGGNSDVYGGLGVVLAGRRDAPVVGVLLGDASAPLAAPAVTGLVSGVRVPASTVVVAGMSSTKKTRWDLKEGLAVVSRWCVLGELGVRAEREMDDAAYQRLTVDYWKTLEAAMERRRVLGRGERARDAAGE